VMVKPRDAWIGGHRLTGRPAGGLPLPVRQNPADLHLSR
jgi:hypothetical protein